MFRTYSVLLRKFCFRTQIIARVSTISVGIKHPLGWPHWRVSSSQEYDHCCSLCSGSFHNTTASSPTSLESMSSGDPVSWDWGEVDILSFSHSCGPKDLVHLSSSELSSGPTQSPRHAASLCSYLQLHGKTEPGTRTRVLLWHTWLCCLREDCWKALEVWSRPWGGMTHAFNLGHTVCRKPL